MAGTLKVDSINADSNLALKIANTAVAFIDATGLRPVAGNLNLDATATSKFYLPSANTVAIQTAGVTAVTVDSSQNVTLAGTASATKLIPTGSSVTGNGMYLPAANSLGLSTNGNNAVYINSSQNVGIGTTSPTARLTVASGTNEGAVRVGDNATYYGELSRVQATDEVRLGSYGGSQKLTFYTVASERMRIDSAGQLIIGPGVANGAGGINTTSTVADGSLNPAIYFNSNYGGGTKGHIYFQRNSSTVGQITENGSTTSYTTTSDYRLKEDVAPMTGALAKVAALKPVTYKWKISGSESQGFIAHELAEVVPDAVVGEKDAVGEQQYEVTPAVKDEEGNTITEAVMGTRTVPDYQGVDTSFLVATLTAAIQELKAIVDAQATRIVALESK